MKTKSFFIVLPFIIFCSCNKEKKSDQTTCQNIQNTTISSNSPINIGEPITFGTQEVGGYRIYSWIGPDNYSSQNSTNSISNAQLQNEGWYYLNLTSTSSYAACQKIDSVYIDVKLLQGLPPCTITNNTATYSNLPGDTYSSVSKYIDPNYSQKVLAANGGIFSNLTIYFHTHWRSTEPEDGIYTTANTPVFDQTDNNYNKVFITTTKNSIYWTSNEDQSVYISHAGLKLQVRFCNLGMSGSNGTSYATIASGNVVEQ